MQEAYCNMLAKYREELARPIQEATEFFKSVETQLDSITFTGILRFQQQYLCAWWQLVLPR